MPTYEWDESKRVANLAKHGVDFAALIDFDWNRVIEFDDIRADYGERRIVAFGMIEGRLYALVYTPRGDKLRVISLRKANRREVGRYHNATKD